MAVLFDMDGVILKGKSTPRGTYYQASNHVLDKIDQSVSETDRNRLEVYSYEKFKKACQSADAPLNPQKLWQEREQMVSELEHKHIMSGSRKLYEDTSVLSSIHENIPIAIVSNNRQATVEFVVDYYDLPVDIAKGRTPSPDGFRRKKPDPHYLTKACNQLEVSAGLYVGDRQKDMIAADRAGISGVFIRREHNESKPLPEKAEYEIHSLRELPDTITKESEIS